MLSLSCTLDLDTYCKVDFKKTEVSSNPLIFDQRVPLSDSPSLIDKGKIEDQFGVPH